MLLQMTSNMHLGFSFLVISIIIHGTIVQSAQVTSGNAQFSNKLFTELVKNEKEENVFFSPISAHTILSLIYQGAEGETQAKLASVLNIPDAKATADGYKDIISGLNNVPNVTLEIANKIWVKQGYKLKNTFQALASNNFYAEAESTNFDNPTVAANSINSWVEQKTKNKIKNLINPDKIDPSTAMVLVNAIYFKGTWAKQFKKEHTHKQTFYVTNNDSIDVDMMHIESDFRYREDVDLDAKILELPYTNRDASMLVILPNKRDGIKDLQEKIVTRDLSTLGKNLRKVKVNVALPKFKIETTINLTQILNDVGLSIIFSDNANFSGLLDDPIPLKVSDAVQKAFVEVNEEGAEAAAATALIFARRLGVRVLRAHVFVVDHPAIFIIQKKHEEPIKTFFPLFMGRLQNPPQSKSF